LCREQNKPLPVSRNYFRSVDYHFWFDVWSSADVPQHSAQLIWQLRNVIRAFPAKMADDSHFWQTGNRNMTETAYTNSQYSTSYSTLIQYMDVTATVWPLETTSGLGDTGSDVIRCRMTSKRLTVDRRDNSHNNGQKWRKTTSDSRFPPNRK